MKTKFKSYYKKRDYEIVDFPQTVIIDTVSLCNLRCSMCTTKDSTRKKGFMDWDLFKKIIDEIAKENKDTTVFMAFSGEPLVRSKYKPNIFEMIKYAKSQGIKRVVMNSNACLLTEENAKNILESGLDEIFLGIDAFSADVYAQNRCGGNYEETVKNILRFLELKKQMKKSKLVIECQFIEMDNNIHQKKDFIKFWTSKGAHVKIRPMLSWGGKSDRKIDIDYLKTRQPCPWAMKTMVISNEGYVLNCGIDLRAEINNGSVYEKSLKEIYNTVLKDFRKKHLEHKFDELNDLCKNCEDWQLAEEKHYHPKVSLLQKLKIFLVNNLV